MILHQLVYTLPELSLLMGIVHLGILYMLSYESARLYARVSRFWLLASIFWNIVFYDKTFSPLYFAMMPILCCSACWRASWHILCLGCRQPGSPSKTGQVADTTF